MDSVLKPIISQLVSQVEMASAEIADQKGVLKQLRSIARRGEARWVCVTKMSLKPQRLYVIRRRHGRLQKTPPSEPAVYRWTDSGWRQVYGYLPEGRGAGTTVEVLTR